MAKIRIRFLVNHVVQDEHAGTDRETRYIAGRTYTVAEDTARHFVSRQMAEPANAATRDLLTGV